MSDRAPYAGESSVNSFAEIPQRPTWGQGSIVWNLKPVVLGSPGSRYTVIGWRRVIDAKPDNSNHVLGVDWVEMRCLTGT